LKQIESFVKDLSNGPIPIKDLGCVIMYYINKAILDDSHRFINLLNKAIFKQYPPQYNPFDESYHNEAANLLTKCTEVDYAHFEWISNELMLLFSHFMDYKGKAFVADVYCTILKDTFGAPPGKIRIERVSVDAYTRTAEDHVRKNIQRGTLESAIDSSDDAKFIEPWLKQFRDDIIDQEIDFIKR